MKTLTFSVDVYNNGGGIRYVCKNAFKKWTELFWKGIAICTVQAELAAHGTFCGGACNLLRSKDIFAVSGIRIESPTLKVSDFHCKFDHSQGELPASLINDWKGHIADAINKEFKTNVGKWTGILNTQIAEQLQNDSALPSRCNPR